MIKDFQIAFLGPYPHPEQVKEGWMSRVSSIDQAFKSVKRIYIHIDIAISDEEQREVQIDNLSSVVYLNPYSEKGKGMLDRYVEMVKGIYCHTLHLAEYLLDYLDSNKVCVDIHGITPEEEHMMGNPDNVERYERVERLVLEKAKLCVMVTNAMANHYKTKYPDIKFNWIKVGIYELYPEFDKNVSESSEELPVNVIYAGGTQSWQNVDKMISISKDATQYANFTFFSHEHHVFEDKVDFEPINSLNIGFCEKSDLPRNYLLNDFGFILREPTPVNYVACPTKLIEYLCYGVIPVVESEEIGDFKEYGYEYVYAKDFIKGNFPDSLTRKWMANRNLAVARKMRVDFESAVLELPLKVMA